MDGWTLTVASIDHRAITEVRLSQVLDEAEAEAEAEPVLDEARG
ncbi:hypothetical protein GCM10027614_77780 [Micromonospora vulcania]